jgi:hypothetical protein
MEMKNVYNDPDYKDVRENLHNRLKNIMAEFDDSEEKARGILDAEILKN